MKQEIEIEFKNLVTKQEFDELIAHFNIGEEDFITQDNHYFDTTSFSLKDCGAALRIRYKKGGYVLTLKQPHEQGLLETHQFLTEDEAKAFMNGQVHVTGKIRELIERLGVDVTELLYFGTLTTRRVEKPYKDGLLVFDHSLYLEKEDYELEYEVKNAKEGKENFKQLLHSLHIPIRKTENKIRRFYREKYIALSEESS
ncbi:CYTH domain-containing protein [Bacillus sp. CGMCC 1.16541]|uniref:CYTH domain-containing protein n=1 Tax=Bacillus sp. CGMCC 1.16541 TaxID=2185143 RepID=UPI000D737E48|nr:CYTH domain-containing protein [Bacillus sp. CGMCC 1.16541]